ncbi:MAG: DNA repair protein RecO [Candidatus Limnocylindrales bacterium]
MASRTYRAEAIVLKTMDLGEADRILTLLTRHYGKVRVIAKGIRKPTSRLAGHAEPLVHATFQLARGRDLDVLTGAETRATYRALREDLPVIAAGWYISELADRFSVERSTSVPVFDLVETALAALEAGAFPAIVCRWFDLHLLDRSGFRPELGRCVQCRRAPEEVTNVWHPDAGGLVCARCAEAWTHGSLALSVRALKTLRYLFVSDLSTALLLKVDAALAHELEQHLRGFLHHVLDRDIHASRLLEEIARLPQPVASAV